MKYFVVMIPTDGSHISYAYEFDNLKDAEFEYERRVDFYGSMYAIYLTQEIPTT